MDRVTEFRGRYRFLSNFYPCSVTLAGVQYPTVENAYQAAKRPYAEDRKVFETCDPGYAKLLGRHGAVRFNWDTVKVKLMRKLIAQKFTEGTELARLLLATGGAILEEGNTWGDTFWGVCNGRGQNNLGKLLMEQRSALTPASSPSQQLAG